MIDGFEVAILDLRPDLAKSLYESYADLFGKKKALDALIPDTLLEQFYKLKNRGPHNHQDYLETFTFLLDDLEISTERFSNVIEACYLDMIDYEGFGQFIASLGSLEILEDTRVQEQLQINAVRALVFAGEHDLFALTYNQKLSEEDKKSIITPKWMDEVKAQGHWDKLVRLVPSLEQSKDTADDARPNQEHASHLLTSEQRKLTPASSKASEFDDRFDIEDLGIMMPLYRASKKQQDACELCVSQHQPALDSEKAKTSNKL